MLSATRYVYPIVGHKVLIPKVPQNGVGGDHDVCFHAQLVVMIYMKDDKRWCVKCIVSDTRHAFIVTIPLIGYP